jgi:hypothetical protein
VLFIYNAYLEKSFCIIVVVVVVVVICSSRVSILWAGTCYAVMVLF